MLDDVSESVNTDAVRNVTAFVKIGGEKIIEESIIAWDKKFMVIRRRRRAKGQMIGGVLVADKSDSNKNEKKEKEEEEEGGDLLTTNKETLTGFRTIGATVASFLYKGRKKSDDYGDGKASLLLSRINNDDDDKHAGSGVADKSDTRNSVLPDTDSIATTNDNGTNLIGRESTTAIVRVPMSPRSNNPEELPGPGNEEKILLPHPKGSRIKNTEVKDGNGTPAKIPSPTHHSSMESPSGSGYIVSVALVLVVGAIVGVLATVSHHFHRRYQRRLPDAPGAPDAPSTTDNRYQPPPTRRLHHYATPMLSVSGGMEVGSGGRGGRGALGGSLQGGPTTGTENDVVAATRDRAVRASSVRQDLALDLPPRLQLPDGEERPYGAHAGLHLRDPEQESEIYQKCVRPPPNRTVFDSESPPAYRSQSALLDAPDRIVRCHSAGSSLLKVFRKFPTSGSSTPSVIVPRRPTLSSYSESSSNLSNLSSLTVVPCETDETQNHV